MKSLCFLVFISFSLLASSFEKVTSLLPEEMKKLSLHKSSPKDAEKILGKADLVEGKKYYWKRNGFKYAIELSFDGKEKLSSLHYTFTGNKPVFDVDVKKLVPAGKYFRFKEDNFELMVDPLTNKVYSVKLL